MLPCCVSSYCVFSDIRHESDGGSPTPYLRLRPRARWSLVNARELWEFRDLLVTFAGRDIRLRYRQTALGVIWVVLQPLLAAGILSFVFGGVAKLPSDGVPYFVFAYTGTLAWSAFSGTLTKSAGVLVGNAALVSKIFFPRMLLPLSVLGSTMLDFVVGLAVMAVLLVVGGVAPGAGIILLPLWLLLTLLMAMGVGLFASALMVWYRDVQYVLPVAIQFGLFASPVAYSLRAVPDSSRFLFMLNPLVGVLEAFRWSLIHRSPLPIGPLAYSAASSLVLFIVGAAFFVKMEQRFADVI